MSKANDKRKELEAERLKQEALAGFTTQFTCFTSAKVQALTPEELHFCRKPAWQRREQKRLWAACARVCATSVCALKLLIVYEALSYYWCAGAGACACTSVVLY